MINVALLADHAGTIPILAQWFRTQWPDYYATRTLGAVAQDFYAEAKRNGLSIRLVAFVDEALAGTIVLREQALTAFPEYSPGLGGLFVTERYRRHGVGTELVSGGMNLAREQGYDVVYAGTAVAHGLLEHQGWEMVRTVLHAQEQLAIYRCRLRT